MDTIGTRTGMEVQLIASFPDSERMFGALSEIRKQNPLDIRILGGGFPGQAVSASPTASAETGGELPRYAISVWVERSRYRRTEDTILRFQGALGYGTAPSLVFPQDIH